MKTFKEFINERLSSIKASKKIQDPELSRYVYNLNYDKVEELLSSGVDPDSKPSSRGDKEYPLHEASNIPDLRMVKLLLSYGADVNIKSISEGDSPLMYALASEDKGDSVVDYLLDNGADINAVDFEGNTILKNIAYYGKSFDMFEYLLDKVDLNKGNKYGRTALYDAILRGNKEYAIKLLEHGADPYHKDSHGKTPYDLAVSKEEHEDIAKYIEEHK